MNVTVVGTINRLSYNQFFQRLSYLVNSSLNKHSNDPTMKDLV